jgi:hypothetical protein
MNPGHTLVSTMPRCRASCALATIHLSTAAFDAQ